MQSLENQVNTSYFEKLRNLCDSGRVSLYLVVAPPRTNSTLVEHILGNSPDIGKECHEPFFGAGRPSFDQDQGYKQIYDSLGGAEFEESGKSIKVAVKDIAQWTSVHEEYKKLFSLTENPILILIRNPLLSAESRIKKILASLEKKISSEELNSKAAALGFKSWQNLIQVSTETTRDYTIFDLLLGEQIKGWVADKSDFYELNEQVEYLDSIKKPYYIVDTTDLRANPEAVVQELCALLKITYSDKMIAWGSSQAVDFHTGQNSEGSKVWYDTLHESSKINPPTEIPLPLAMFPASTREYVQKYNLPIYFSLAQRKCISETVKSSLNETAHSIEVTEKNSEILRHFGVIGAKSQLGTIPTKLKFIDPIYAITNEPELLKDAEFTSRKKDYAHEISLRV
jgi:hypothetical protein